LGAAPTAIVGQSEPGRLGVHRRTAPRGIWEEMGEDYLLMVC